MELPGPSVLTAVAITVGLVEIAKRIDKERQFSRFYPAVALIVGTVVASIFMFAWWVALIVGLSAAGVWDLGKKSILGR